MLFFTSMGLAMFPGCVIYGVWMAIRLIRLQRKEKALKKELEKPILWEIPQNNYTFSIDVSSVNWSFLTSPTLKPLSKKHPLTNIFKD